MEQKLLNLLRDLLSEVNELSNGKSTGPAYDEASKIVSSNDENPNQIKLDFDGGEN